MDASPRLCLRHFFVRLSLATALTAALALGMSARPAAAQTSQGQTIKVVGQALVNFTDLARQERLGVASKPPVRPLMRREEEDNDQEEPGAGVFGTTSLERPPFVPFVASPSPSISFQGLDDVPMADSSYIIIPPDVSGGVGPNRVMCGFNNNYRVLDKATGAVIQTVGTATFWNPVVTNKALLNQLTDPRTVYDPIQNRWIVAMQTVNTDGLVLIGVSTGTDPAGSWFLYAFQLSPTGYLIDFPTLGFNKNWICVSINRYTTAGAFNRGVQLVANYPQARAGTLASITQFDPGTGAGTRFVASPCVTMSATEDSLFLVTHLGSAGATFQVDVISGTPASPSYTSGTITTRPGGGWTQPSGNQLPQSLPNSGTSACGATACPIEAQDAQVRSAPMYRNGLIYYAQSIRLTSPAVRNAVQWTKITPSTTPAVSDGGRIDDATGAKWYAYPHIAVNANEDFIVGYTQFSTTQHPAAGYSMHLAGDAAGSIRDAVIAHAGEDYYHKTFSTATGRNRWGDFTTAQVDPSDDMTLWTLQEYGKARVGTNDGNTGSNSSRWSSWWAAVSPPTVTIDTGPSQNEGNAGTSAFNFTIRLSYAYGLPITVNYHTVDGSATTADNDYQAVSTNVVIPAGSTTVPVSVNVNGDAVCEPNEAFSVALTSANNNIQLGLTTSATAFILNDDASTIALGETHVGVSCNGAANGSIDLSASGGTGALSYLWSNGATTQDLTGLSGGNYSVTVTDANGCQSNLGPISVIEPAVLSLSETHADVSTCGASNGSIDLTVAGGTAPFSYAWSNGATTEDLSGLASGSYTVTVTDAHGCQQQKTVGITAPNAPGLSQTHVNVTCNGAANGSIDLTVTGGTAPFTYAWSNSATTQDLAGLGPGTYSVTVTDASNCQTTLANITISEPAVLALSETHTNVCTGGTDGTVDLTVAGGTGPYSYAWSNGATTEDLTGLAAGPYSVTVTDAHGCTQNKSVTIAVTDHAIVATAGANGTISPPGSTNVPCGTDQTYTITPNSGYTVSQLTVDGSPVTPATSYTFTNVTAAHTIDAQFAAVTAATMPAAAFALGAVMPNPTRAGMQVPFGLPQAARVRVSVIDLQGRELAVLADGEYGPGWHTAVWNGRTAQGDAGSGLYFVRYRLAGRTVMRKFVLAR